MEHKLKLILIISLPSATVLTLLFAFTIFCCSRGKKTGSRDVEQGGKPGEVVVNSEDLIKFQGGKDLLVREILDAPGEVIGKSSYGTIYRACLDNTKSNSKNLNSVLLLRFLRPTCTLRMQEVMPLVHMLGCVRHKNLVPLIGFYAGERGEKLMVQPFLGIGNLDQVIGDSNGESHKWPVIRRISIGIARAIHHLHTCSDKPIIHGNLKSKNILLDKHFQPYVSDFGLHLFLNLTAGQQMLESSASQGYKAPELIKMKDVNEESDIYSLGVIFLEMLTGKEPVNNNFDSGQDFYLPSVMRSAVLDDRIIDLYNPDIFVGLSDDRRALVEDCVLGFFQLAMACCSPAKLRRPDIKQVLERLEEIGN